MAARPTESEVPVPKFANLTDLASAAVGGKILFSTDDWFASADNMLKTNEPEWREGVYTEYGKWMDGWESARKRTVGHDWCILRLGVPGTIQGFEVNTAFFTGNYAPMISIQAAGGIDEPLALQRWYSAMGNRATQEDYDVTATLKSEDWETLLPKTKLGPGYKGVNRFFFAVASQQRWTHLRVNIFPDGGVARLRVYGLAHPTFAHLRAGQTADLAAVENGGLAVSWSDNHFGHPRNLVGPGRGVGMFDGWETARRKDRPAVLLPGTDGHLQFVGSEWSVIQLGTRGVVVKLEVDTAHFKGNYPESCMIEGCQAKTWPTSMVGPQSAQMQAMGPWRVLVPRTKLSANSRHFFSVQPGEPVSHIRLTMFPDGGISRLRVHCLLPAQASL
eukprot:m.100134 g.100134  ORF g.100134 m.100134 type:complete len:389 (-) comp8741_c0_seq2:2032-3198(-)